MSLCDVLSHSFDAHLIANMAINRIRFKGIIFCLPFSHRHFLQSIKSLGVFNIFFNFIEVDLIRQVFLEKKSAELTIARLICLPLQYAAPFSLACIGYVWRREEMSAFCAVPNIAYLHFASIKPPFADFFFYQNFSISPS